MSEVALKELLNRSTLRRMAGAASFERGEAYFGNRSVGSLLEHEDTISAKVRGTQTYRVKLWSKSSELEYSCTCPVGRDGAFCKHCVAVGLAWLEQGKVADTKGRKRPKATLTTDDVRAHLEEQSKKSLVDLLMEHAVGDDRLRQRLLMKAARGAPGRVGLATYRQAIDEAVDVGGFVDYRGASSYASGIEEAIDSIEDLMKDGHEAEAIELTEYALESVEDAMGSVDDSDGEMGSILQRLQELHHSACKKAKPNVEELAERLFEWETGTDYDIFYGAAASYADVLGEKGLAIYRRLAEREWKKVPTLAPGGDDSAKYGKRFRITHIMETLARASGNVEALVDVMKRDLSLPYHFLKIAETYKEARHHDFALEWAERGVEAFPERTDSRLREFLAEEYHRLKRHDEAMALIWAEFSERPVLEQYRHLKAHADRAGQWSLWREKAIGFLRETMVRKKRDASKSRWAWQHHDHSDLVAILLWEKDVDAAWREAKEGGCSNELWLKLAGKREKDHPDEALPVYRSQVEPALNRKNNEAYREVIGLLQKVRKLMIRLGREPEFTRYVESVRAAHKPKRNFIRLLDGANWS